MIDLSLSFSYSHELQNNIVGKFLSQYTNFSDAKESNQNYYGLWESRLL
jgi:hypothetical protein